MRTAILIIFSCTLACHAFSVSESKDTKSLDVTKRTPSFGRFISITRAGALPVIPHFKSKRGLHISPNSPHGNDDGNFVSVVAGAPLEKRSPHFDEAQRDGMSSFEASLRGCVATHPPPKSADKSRHPRRSEEADARDGMEENIPNEADKDPEIAKRDPRNTNTKADRSGFAQCFGHVRGVVSGWEDDYYFKHDGFKQDKKPKKQTSDSGKRSHHKRRDIFAESKTTKRNPARSNTDGQPSEWARLYSYVRQTAPRVSTWRNHLLAPDSGQDSKDDSDKDGKSASEHTSHHKRSDVTEDIGLEKREPSFPEISWGGQQWNEHGPGGMRGIIGIYWLPDTERSGNSDGEGSNQRKSRVKRSGVSPKLRKRTRAPRIPGGFEPAPQNVRMAMPSQPMIHTPDSGSSKGNKSSHKDDKKSRDHDGQKSHHKVKRASLSGRSTLKSRPQQFRIATHIMDWLGLGGERDGGTILSGSGAIPAENISGSMEHWKHADKEDYSKRSGNSQIQRKRKAAMKPHHWAAGARHPVIVLATLGQAPQPANDDGGFSKIGSASTIANT